MLYRRVKILCESLETIGFTKQNEMEFISISARIDLMAKQVTALKHRHVASMQQKHQFYTDIHIHRTLLWVEFFQVITERMLYEGKRLNYIVKRS